MCTYGTTCLEMDSQHGELLPAWLRQVRIATDILSHNGLGEVRSGATVVPTNSEVRWWPQLWFSQLITWQPQPIFNPTVIRCYKSSWARPFLSPSNQQHFFAGRSQRQNWGTKRFKEPAGLREFRATSLPYHVWLHHPLVEHTSCWYVTSLTSTRW